MLDVLREMPPGVRVILAFGFVLLAILGLTLPLVVNQAVTAPISELGLLWMLLLAYLVFTLTLILQRKQAGWLLSVGLASLSVPLIAVLYFWSPPAALAGVAIAVVLFVSLRASRTKAWYSEP